MTTYLNKSSYEAIANEYYDSRHVTSRNFDQATLEFCRTNKHQFPVPQNGIILETGCGKGSVNRYFGIDLTRVVQTDIALRMLKLDPREYSLYAVQCDAVNLPFHNGSFSAVFSFLYDPYNVEKFYSELERILIPTGIFVGTLPHFEWGSSLRNKLKIDKSKTQIRKFSSEKDNEFIEFNSFLADDNQIQIFMSNAGLKLLGSYDLFLPPYVKHISPHIKLSAANLGKSSYDLSIVKMIVAKK